jgi:hypothetical protein
MANEKYINQDSANQLISLIFSKIATDISGNITTDITGAANNLKAAGAKAVKDYVTSAISEIGGINLNFAVVETLPTENISATTIYLVPKTDTTTGDGYDEYIYINTAWEKLGTTSIDLSGYWQKSELASLSAADITEIWNQVAGA